MSDVLSTTNLSKRFGRVFAVNGVSLQIAEGSVYGLVGPNGAGKTTLIKCLMNIVQPSSGKAEVLGADSRQLSPEHFAQIGYVSENQDLPEWMTVDYWMRYLQPFYPAWDEARARELLDEFHLPRDRKLRHLSRGMRMKVALASSLAYRPKLIVLDEPFSGLDPLMRQELVEGLLDSSEETTILISSHDLAEIETFASHIGYLEEGRLQFSEEMTSLTQRFREVEVTLDAPLNLPRPWPTHWLHPETSASVVHFVEMQFEPERTLAEVRRLFGTAARTEVTPMPLRAIFVTLARAAQKAA